MLANDAYWFAVSLRLSGDGFDPDTLEPLLGIAPDHLGRKGQPRRGKDGRKYAPYQTNLWTHQVPAPKGIGFDDQIQMLFASLHGRLEFLKELASRQDVDAELFCGFGSGTGQGGDTLLPETLKLLVDAGLSLTLDLYPPTIDTDENAE